MKRLGFSSICVLALSCAANATAIYNNLGSPTSFFDGVCPIGAPPPQCFGPLADSFSTGPTTFELNRVGVLLSGDPTTGGTTSVELLSNNGGKPGPSLLTLGTVSDSSLGSTFAEFFFPAALPISPNTRYWIKLSDSSSAGLHTSADWAVCVFADCGTDLGVAGEFFANGNDTFPCKGFPCVFPNRLGPYQMEVDVLQTAVPEPSSFLLLGSGLLGLIGAVRRRRLT